MPTFRRVPAVEATTWQTTGSRRVPVPDPAEVAYLKAQLADARGITRIDRAGTAGGEHAWRARVYTRGIELHKQFSDTRYGGVYAALEAARNWRDRYRVLAGPRPPGTGRTPRVVRAEYRRMCGWIAYTPADKRYFADRAWGGRAAGYAVAHAWMADIIAATQG